MIDIVRETIRETALLAGIKNVIDMTKDSILLPKPYLAVQLVGESFDKTGYTLAGSSEEDFIKIILTKYKGRLSVNCSIVHDNESELIEIADKFIKTLPRAVADSENNLIKVQAVTGEWQLIGGKQIGMEKMEVIVKRSRVIKIEFIYHIADEQRLSYLKEVDIRLKSVK